MHFAEDVLLASDFISNVNYFLRNTQAQDPGVQGFWEVGPKTIFKALKAVREFWRKLCNTGSFPGHIDIQEQTSWQCFIKLF